MQVETWKETDQRQRPFIPEFACFRFQDRLSLHVDGLLAADRRQCLLELRDEGFMYADEVKAVMERYRGVAEPLIERVDAHDEYVVDAHIPVCFLRP